LTVSTSLLLSPKLGTCVRTLAPARNFCSSKSHLFRNSIICVLESIWSEHNVCQSMYVSSNRLTRRSSRSRSSNEEMGARKMIASMSSKNGYQWARCHEHQSRVRCERGRERERRRASNPPKIWSRQHHTLTIHGYLQSKV
jgi:hypothetical protein